MKQNRLIQMRLLAFALCAAFLPSCATVPQASSPERAPVVIVGAGLTGLTVAYKLQAAGIPAIILEANSRIGGRVQTVYFKGGIYAEAHMEEYFERSPAVPLLRELKLPLSQDVAHSSIRMDDKIYPYTGEGDRDAYLSGVFSPDEKAAFMQWNRRAWEIYEQLHATFFHGKPIPSDLEKLERQKFSDFVSQLGLPPRVSEWIRIYIEAETAIEWDQISALDGIDEMRLFLDTPAGFGEMNYHVAGGNSKFIQALASHLAPGQLMINAQVTAIERTPDGVHVRYLKDAARYGEILARAVVVTAPVYTLKNIQFVPPLSQQKSRAIATTRYGAYIKVHFLVDEAAEPLWMKDGKTVMTLLSDSPAGTIYEATEFQKATRGGTHDRILTMLVHARFARQMLGMSIDEMRDYSRANLDKLFPGIARYVKRAEIFVYPNAVAYWPVQLGRSRFDADADELRRPEDGLYIGGDTTEDSHSEGAVRAGLRMAQQLIERKKELLGNSVEAAGAR